MGQGKTSLKLLQDFLSVCLCQVPTTFLGTQVDSSSWENSLCRFPAVHFEGTAVMRRFESAHDSRASHNYLEIEAQQQSLCQYSTDARNLVKWCVLLDIPLTPCEARPIKVDLRSRTCGTSAYLPERHLISIRIDDKPQTKTLRHR